MQTVSLRTADDRKTFYAWASALAVITIGYNIVEGLVSVFFGFTDESLSLFGFGVDSFVEVVSGLGIWHMVRRMRQNGSETPDTFERNALKTTGTAFYLLTAGLLLTSALNIYRGSRPETTLWGIIVSAISILTMWLLMHYKLKVGRQFNSPALIADAHCTKTCIYLSFVLLAASLGYELTGVGTLDSAGALIIAFLSFREGREAFEKAKGNFSCSCQGDCHSGK
jgi:divalent metal cation (Fe/Co/Zn/Cd) transporter